MPPFPPGTEWIGDEPRDAERVAAGGPVLVHFLDPAQLNCVRSIPYVLEWDRRYADFGLRTIGMHTPRFGFTKDPEVAAECMMGLGIRHPVAIDAEHRAWHDYGCQGWPSLFLFSKGGALRWYHLGEGAYEETERAIQGELDAARSGPAASGSSTASSTADWPDPVEPIRPSDAPGAKVVPPTGELFPGGSPDLPWRAPDEEASIELAYAAGGVAASVSGRGEIVVRLDGDAAPGVPVTGPGLVEVARHPAHEEHRIELRADGNVEIWSVSFPPGTPSRAPAV